MGGASRGFAGRSELGHSGVGHTASFNGRGDTRGNIEAGRTRFGRGAGERGRVASTGGDRSGRGGGDRSGRGSGDYPARGGGDRSGRGGDDPGSSRWPVWPHRQHWALPPGQNVNPVIGTTPANGGRPPGGNGIAPLTAKRSGSGVPTAGETRYVPDEVVLEVATSMSDQQIGALARRFRLTRLQSTPFRLGGTTLMRWRIPDRRSVPTVVRALEADAGVLSAQPNYLYAIQEDQGQTPAPHEGDPAQYVLDKMHLPQAHEIARGKVSVAVIDSGIDLTSPELTGDIAGSLDALGTGAKVHAHGTAIAGAIAAHGRLMGAAPAARIFAVRAFSGSDGDNGTTYAILTGLDWAVQRGVRVVNMSFAGPQDPAIAVGLAAANHQGVVLIAAAGNKGAKSPPLFPAADRNVIAVTSTDEHDQLPAFANRGPYVAVAAPGVDLMLLAPNGSLQFASGTSFSAAYVTGTVALMLERDPGLTPEAVRRALMASAHPLPPLQAGIADSLSGGGLADAYAVLQAVAPVAVDAAVRPEPVADHR